MFTIIKKYTEYNNYVNYMLVHDSRKLVGYQHFEESHFNAIRAIVQPDKLDTKVIDWNCSASATNKILKEGTKIQAIEYSFQATEQQVSDAGIMYLLDRKSKWATSTDIHNINPNFELVSVKEAIEVCCN